MEAMQEALQTLHMASLICDHHLIVFTLSAATIQKREALYWSDLESAHPQVPIMVWFYLFLKLENTVGLVKCGTFFNCRQWENRDDLCSTGIVLSWSSGCVPSAFDFQEVSKNDSYCWICHEGGEVLCCDKCPRVLHLRCSNLTSEPEGDEWNCPTCRVGHPFV